MEYEIRLRLAPGTTFEQATALAQSFEDAEPAVTDAWGVFVAPVSS